MKFKVGGTPDCYSVLDGVLTLLEFKTFRKIRPESMYQLDAYKKMLEENRHAVEQVKVLRLQHGDNSDFEERTKLDLSKELDVFLACKQLYEALKLGK